MANPNPGASGRDPLLDRVIADYLDAERSGQTPDRQALLDQYPELAADLTAFFADHDKMKGLVQPMAQPVEATLPLEPRSSDEKTLPPEPRRADELTLPPGQAVGPPIGTKVRYFGDYELLEEIARGGMGVVYKARQVSLNRIVALKMILAGQLAGEDDVKRFYTEAEAAAKLDHPGIVPIFEIGQHEGQHYFSMGYVEGASLAKKVADGPLTPREAAEMVAKIAAAVEYAHQQGIIHRDLKPANVLLKQSRESRVQSPEPAGSRSGSRLSTLDCQPMVTDFGLAKQLKADSGLTGTGQILGTPSYMPPEQAAGKIDEIGPAADVYALGAILYCLLTGRPPFQSANPMDTLLAVLDQEPVPLRQLNAQTPLDLETIALKCLEKSPARRYATVQELADELQRFINGEPVLARPVGAAGRLWRWCKRRPLVAGLIGAVTLSLMIGTVISTYFAIEARREELSARRHLYTGQINLAQRAWNDGQTTYTMNLLESQRPEQTGGIDLRHFEWYYLMGLCHSELRAITDHTAPVESVAFSPGGQRLASTSGDGTVRIWDVGTGKELRRLGGGGQCVAFSPDGGRLAWGVGQAWNQPGEVAVCDLSTGREVLRLKGHARGVAALAFSPDGRRLVSADAGGTVKAWSTNGGEEVWSAAGHASTVWSVAFSPDGKRATSAGADGTVKMWTADTGREQRAWDVTSDGKKYGVYGVAFSPDGLRLASGGHDKKVRIWDANSGKLLHVLEGHAGAIRSVAFSLDGQLLASGGGEWMSEKPGEVKVWDCRTGQELRCFKGHTDQVTSVALSADGRRLASASEDHTIRIWDVRNSQEFRAFEQRSGGAGTSVVYSPDGKYLAAGYSFFVKVSDASTGLEILSIQGGRDRLAFSPDGQRLATGSSNPTAPGEIKVWDTRTGREIITIKAHQGRGLISSLAFSPDGQRLVSSSFTDNSVRIWEADAGRELLAINHDGDVQGVVSAALSPDGQRLATIPSIRSRDNNSVRVWDARDGRQLLTIETPGNLYGIAFSPDGRRLVSALHRGYHKGSEVFVWDARNGHELLALKGHRDQVTSVTFTLDGHRLASATAEGTVKIWDADTGQELLALSGALGDAPFSKDGQHALAFSPDGRQLASIRENGTVIEWDAREATPESRVDREAAGLLKFFFDKPLPKGEVIEKLKGDPTISEEARRRALEFADRLRDRP